MPVYDYRCADCGVFDAARRIAERDDALRCPRCGAEAQRVTVSAPALATGSADSGSSGEGSYARMRHVGGCSCCR